MQHGPEAALTQSAASARLRARMNPTAPPISVLVKLGSIARHTDELLSPDGHEFDRATLQGLLRDPEVVEWMRQADALALLPVRRS
jgi:hypothetical protein